MDWKAHIFFGALLGGAGAYLFLGDGLLFVASFAFVSGISALIPDIDERKSKASQILLLALLAAAIVAAQTLSQGWDAAVFFVRASLLFVTGVLLLELLRPRHRGITHTLLFLAAISIASLILLGLPLAAAVFIGCGSHLAVDRCLKLV